MESDRLKAILDEIEESLESDEYEIFPDGLTYEQLDALLALISEKITMNTK
jgi:hypothetical protein